MRLIRFLLHEQGYRWLLITLFLGSPAVSYMMIGRYLSKAATLPRDQLADPADFFAFCVLVVIFAATQFWCYSYLNLLLERGTAAARLRILGYLRHLRLGDIDRIGRAEIYASLSTQIRTISDGAALLMRAATNVSGVMVFVPLVAIISPPAVLLVLATMLVIAVVYSINYATVSRAMTEERHFGGLFQASFRQLLAGIKELKLHRPMAAAFFALSLERSVHAARAAHLTAGRRLQLSAVIHTVALFSFAGFVVFLLPYLVSGEDAAASQVAALATFLNIGALRELQVLGAANESAAQIAEIENTLRTAARSGRLTAQPIDSAASFESLTFDQVTFRYPDDGSEQGFAVGPLSFTILAGTLTFIVGGNGSGKSTVMRLLTGLYPPRSGRILLNGEPVDMARHGHLFSAIFADYHLFDRLYGMRLVDEESFNRQLDRLQIANKTLYHDGRFTTLDLSMGQKKRVALAITRLEDKPVYVLDEWAADQDPEFRVIFYNDLLPELKSLGKTIIAVTHDDRYQHIADHVLRLDFGRIASRPSTAPRRARSAASC